MFSFTKVFLLFFAFCRASALVGGRNSSVGEFPAFVGIVLPLNNAICGASIFNRNHVLTVANCMLNANNLLLGSNQVSIIFGSNNIDFNLPRMSVNAIYVHPQYNPFTFENDIAVVRTQTDFIFPQVPIPLVAPADIGTRISKTSPVVIVTNLIFSIQQLLIHKVASLLHGTLEPMCNKL